MNICSRLVKMVNRFRPMDFFIKLHEIKAGWFIVYIEVSQATISKNIVCLSLKIDFVSANSADPDEELHYACQCTKC